MYVPDDLLPARINVVDSGTPGHGRGNLAEELVRNVLFSNRSWHPRDSAVENAMSLPPKKNDVEHGDHYWAITVTGWGTLYAIGTEAQAETWRRLKAISEGTSARMRVTTADEWHMWTHLGELL